MEEAIAFVKSSPSGKPSPPHRVLPEDPVCRIAVPPTHEVFVTAVPSTSLPPKIELRRVSQRLPSGDRLLTILDDVDLAIAPGEFVAILGPSGSGKSTLLGLMAGLDRPASGEVLLDGRPIHTLTEDELALLRRREIGFVFQSFELLDNFTARENVLLPLELVDTKNPRARADELLAEVGLGERGHHYPAQLSGGERQRVALARAFAARPSLLLADEPTGNLDSATGERVLAILERLRARESTTLVLVTHDPALAARADRRVHLLDGRIDRIECRSGAAA
jgi:putative ABC transport system ATP-binding protein